MVNINRLCKLLDTMNRVEVRGKENMELYLGCMYELEKIIDEEMKYDGSHGQHDRGTSGRIGDPVE